MAMLEYNEITVKKYIVIDGAPYEVLENHIARTQQRKPQNQTKVKNLLTGRLSNMTFHASDKVEEADIDTKEVKYLYNSRGVWWFSEANDPSKRFQISEEILGVQAKFLKPNFVYDAQIFNGEVFGVKLDPMVELKVLEAPPSIKGDTARGGNKNVVVEGGAVVSVPLFVNEGDIIRINTENGEYRERV
ncbi:MAG: elongation factor P [Candidatus Paceibacterota bacterium]|jgi:elongation factor P